jgi:hypothetical protein
MNRAFIVLGIMALGLSARAQLHGSLGLCGVKPMGDYDQTHPFGFGLTLELKYGIEKVDVGLSTGLYLIMGLQDGGISYTPIGLAPLMGIASYRFLDNRVSPYISFGAGYSHVRTSETVIDDILQTDPSESVFVFAWVARLGVHLESLDLSIGFPKMEDYFEGMDFRLAFRIGKR